jgi:hypothetical protein
MHGSLARVLRAAWGVALVGALAMGCTASFVGDPCIPENVPDDGFDPNESYIETSSVQCRTRVCLVYNFEGNPLDIRDDCGAGDRSCATEERVDQGIYCSCRCAFPEGRDVDTSAPLCDCPSGFECRELLNVEGAGEGAMGGYCVREDADIDL